MEVANFMGYSTQDVSEYAAIQVALAGDGGLWHHQWRRGHVEHLRLCARERGLLRCPVPWIRWTSNLDVVIPRFIEGLKLARN